PNPRRAVLQGWLHPNRSPGFTASRLSYATRAETQHQAAVKVPGSFRPVAGNEHLYSSCNFAESLVETVSKSLRHSCRSELTRQGISLPRSEERRVGKECRTGCWQKQCRER